MTNDSSVELEILNTAAASGDTESAYRLGLLYEKGEEVERDLKIAAKWYRKAALGGHAWAQIAIGYLHAIGLGAPRSENKAREWFSKATSQTEDMDIVAQVAELYFHGFGDGTQWFWADGAEAARLAEIAAAKGNAEGQYRLAEMIMLDWHVKKQKNNRQRARELYTKATNQGHVMANEMLDHHFGEEIAKECEEEEFEIKPQGAPVPS